MTKLTYGTKSNTNPIVDRTKEVCAEDFNEVKASVNALYDADVPFDAHIIATDNPHSVTRAQVGLSNVNNTADIDKPISTLTQTALDGKLATTHNHDTAYEAKNANIQAHIEDVTNNPHSVTKDQVGLGNVPDVDCTIAANVTQTPTRRFVSDEEKARWNSLDGISTTPIFNHTYYVDGSRVDTYVEDGSLTRPWKKISTALTFINADASAHALAGHYELSNYVLKISAGDYSDNLTFNNQKYIRLEGYGVTISGTIDLIQTQQTADYYSRVEFIGMSGYRAEKGQAFTISGNSTFTRNNDSLTYVTYVGCLVTGSVTATGDGTWVVQNISSRFSGTITTETFTDPDSAILLESSDNARFAGAVSGKTSLYNCDLTEFSGAVNITPVFDCRITNCKFGSTVSIVAVKNLDVDGISHKAITDRIPTLTGMTIRSLERSYGLIIDNIAEHADNAAAVTAGLVVGQLYRTVDTLKIVHA